MEAGGGQVSRKDTIAKQPQIEALADVLFAIDSDIVELDRHEARTIARFVVLSDWFDAQLFAAYSGAE